MKTYEYIVKKYNIRPRRQYIVEIPNMGRNNLAELFFELGFTQGVEIGVEKGIYSEVLLKTNPKLHLSCVDPWRASSYEPDIDGVSYDQKHYDECFAEAKKRLSLYDCNILRRESLDAVKDFEDESVDFVYIDGNHDFVNVTNDIYFWEKKVKKGGIVSGHDYVYFPSSKQNHVKRVVQAYARAYGIRPLFIVGAEATRQPGIIRDRYRSWFWVKGQNKIDGRL